MRKYTLAVVGIVATLSTLTSATQHQSRSLSQVATSLDAATVGQIASQVEDRVIGKLNQYFKVQTAPVQRAESSTLSSNTIRQIG